MTRIPALLAITLWTIGSCLADQPQGAPRIQFDRTTFDFGKTSRVATVSGVFKFTNLGDAPLKVEPPRPTCGCTVAELKPDTLAPGATGELPFTLNLGLYRTVMEKHIAVRSNDPLTPEVSLTIRVDYTPLYEFEPMTLAPNLAFGADHTNQFTTLTRTDGQPLKISRLDSSKPWITAVVDPTTASGATNARIRIEIKRDGAPRRFSEYVHVYSAEQTNTPASSIYLSGQIMGEVSLSPEALYWSITGTTPSPLQTADAAITRRITVRSANGRPFELKNPQSTVQGIRVEVVPKEEGRAYELVARLEQTPPGTLSGLVSFETSVAAQSRIEVPVIVNVFKP